MQFTLQTLLLLFVVVASALAALGAGGFVLLAAAAWIVLDCYRRVKVGTIVLSVVGVGILVALLWPARSQVREQPRRLACGKNVRTIAAALNAYRDKHGRYPPAYVTGPDGKPWHSWRVLLLPYLGLDDLYSRYDFDEPWDGPHNAALHTKTPAIYECPSTSSDPGRTSYVAVVGPETIWGDPAKPDSATNFALSDTVLLAETTRNDIFWTAPSDVTYDEAATLLPNSNGERHLSSRHPSIMHVATADGQVWYLPQDIAGDKLQSLLKACQSRSPEFESYATLAPQPVAPPLWQRIEVIADRAAGCGHQPVASIPLWQRAAAGGVFALSFGLMAVRAWRAGGRRKAAIAAKPAKGTA